MVRRLRDGTWAALAALLLLAQPGHTQDRPAKEGPFVNLREYLERTTREGADQAVPRPPRAPRPQPEPRPAIWLLQDADTKIYLFGTVHMLPQGYRWRSAAVNEAIRQADELVLEISDREMMADPSTLLEPMMLGKTAPLAWRVSPDRRETLQRMLGELGIPAEAMNSMHSWAASLMIMALSAMQDMAGDEEEPVGPGEMPGVEDGLTTEFRALNRPISGVETVAEQIGFFSNLSFAQQRTLLEAMIDDYARNAEAPQNRNLLDAWVRGNTDGVTIGDSDIPAMLYEALLTRRNRAWTGWLIARLDRPGTILFAVGAGHLAGPDSVQTMLTARGFAATRID